MEPSDASQHGYERVMSKQSILVLGTNNVVGQRLLSSLDASDWAVPFTCSSMSREAFDKASVVINAVTGSPAVIRHAARQLSALAAQSKAPPRIVHISSITVYGSATGVVTERSPTPGDVSEYAKSHVDAEVLVRSYANTVILRPGCEYGPGCVQWSERIGRWLLARRIGDLGARGDGHCNLLYIDDLINACLRAASEPGLGGECFNLCSTQLTWNEYLCRYAKALSAVPVRRVTKRRLKIETELLAVPLKVAEIFTSKLGIKEPVFPEAIPPSFIRLTEQEISLDSSKAEARLNLKWTRLDEGLRLAASGLLGKS